MRRRTPRLQVNTFPFLAVLLCAMGSLILILLVMDRRAKAVARQKARDASLAAAAERARKDDSQREEWERKRRALHELLVQRHAALLDDVRQLQAKGSAADRNLEQMGQDLSAGTQKLQELRALLAQEQEALGARQAAVKQAAHNDQIARAELERLAGELLQLEQTLAALEALRQREQSTYSLVPYKGRNGVSRRPIYIECTAAGVILHPERLELTGPLFNPVDVRNAVVSRLGAMTASDVAPYLLMLVRPNGISNYYNAQAALLGLKLDFGYELIDQEWALDFSGENPGQPWHASPAVPRIAGNAEAPLANPPSNPRPVRPYRPGGVLGEPTFAGTSGEPGHVAQGSSSLPGTSALPLGPPQPIGIGFRPGPANPGAGNAGERTQPGSAELSVSAVPVPALGPPVSAGGNTGSPRAMPPANVNQMANADKPATPNQAGDAGATGYKAGKAGSIIPLGPPSAEAIKTGQGAGALAPRQPGSGAAAAAGANPPDAQLPPGVENGGTARSGPRPGGGGGDDGDGGPPTSLRPANPFPDEPKVRRPPSPLSRLLGSRDLLILVECSADGVVLHPTGRRFGTEALPARPEPDHALAQAVKQYIARRQAQVLAGEPPYRPLLRFQIHPDGLRAYYRAYPLLEALRLPMSRENVD